MSSLSGQTIQNTYKGLLKLEDSTSGITSGFQSITDGLGNDTGSRIGINFFQSPYGLYNYPLTEPNRFYGVAPQGTVGNSVSANERNNKYFYTFFDRGIVSYSALSINVTTIFTADESIDIAFYKLDNISDVGIVPTQKLSDTYTLTNMLSTGEKTVVFASPLTFSGNGAGYYGFMWSYKTTTPASYSGRLLTNSIGIQTQILQAPLFGFMKNTGGNAAPISFITPTTSTGRIIMTGSTMPSTLVYADYTNLVSSVGSVPPGFLLHTIK